MKILYQSEELLIIDREANIPGPILALWSNGEQSFSYGEGFSGSKIECANPFYQTIYKVINKHLRERFKNKKFICLDCETTGLNPEEDEILSISIVNQNGEVLFDELFKPENHTSWDKAQVIHGIAPADVENKSFLKNKLNDIMKILSQYQLIIGYNLEFDLKFLARAYGFFWIKDLIGDKCDVKDVMLMFAPIYGEKKEPYGYKWQTLETCANYYNYKFKAHNSLEDVKATVYCYNQIMKQKLYLYEVE